MRKQKWETWLKNRDILDRDFKDYLKRETIREGATAIEVNGHLSKAKRNLHFARRILDVLKNCKAIFGTPKISDFLAI